jgi:hypothetical protein
MDSQVERLQTLFDRFKIPDDNREEYGDEDVLGECWEWRDPHEVEYWTLMLVPTTQNLSFMTKYNKSEANLPVSLNETVREVNTGPRDVIFVCCKTVDPDQNSEYLFSYVINTRKTIFSISAYYKSLEDTSFRELQKPLGLQIADKR